MAENPGLTPHEVTLAKARYMHSIDPDNYPNPDNPEPIPMFGEGEDVAPVAEPTPEPDVHSESNSTKNVRDEEVYAGDFSDFQLAGPEGQIEDDTQPSRAEEFDGFALKPLEEELPEPVEEDDGGFIDAVVGGTKTSWNAIKSTVNTYLGDAEALEKNALEGGEIERTADQEAFGKELQRLVETGDDSIIDGLMNVMSAAKEQPLGAAHEVVAQAPNSVVVLGTMAAGAKLGAVGGAVIGGPVGALIGAVGGGVVGMFGGNALIETGHLAQEEAMKPGVITGEMMDEAASAGAKKALVITAVDTISMGLNRAMMGAPGRAATGAVNKVLLENGVDLTSEAAVKAALASEKILRASTDAAALAVAGTLTTGKKLARNAAGMVIESTAEGTGEYLGTLAAGREASFTEAALEAMMSLPQSAVELGASKAFAKKPPIAGSDPATTLADEVDARAQSDTPEADAAQEGALQSAEAESRVADMEDAQQAARDEVAEQGGDMLDQEMAAAEVSERLGREEDGIKRHLANMQQRVDAEMKVSAEADKLAAEKEKQQKLDTIETEGGVTSAVMKTQRDMAADDVVDQKEKEINLKTRRKNIKAGQTYKGDVTAGHITEEISQEQGESVEAAASGTSSAMAEAFAAAADVAATSPRNDLEDPTAAQKEAGNYQKGHARMHGLPVSIENPAGSTREASDGSWKQKMSDHYGYIPGTESAEGADEPLDVFVGEDHDSDTIVVVDQINKQGEFDEHKVMMGYPNAVAARRAYARNYPQGFKVGKLTTMTVEEFKDWLNNGDQTVPLHSETKVGDRPAATASPEKEVVQSKSREGGTVSRAEQIEEDLVEPRGKVPRRIRHSKKGFVDAKTLLGEIQKDGDGFTVDNKTGEKKKEGFSAGIGKERVFKGRKATPEEIEKFREDNAEDLAREDHYLGSWMHEGDMFLDVSKVFSPDAKGRAGAVALGKANKEIGIQDLSKSAEEGFILLADEKDPEGRTFRDFFSAVTKGLTGESSTGAEYVPVVDSVAQAMVEEGSEVNAYSTEYAKHRGKFDDHIAFSIPGYKEVQQAVGAALVNVYDSNSNMLDIGASEGSFAKAITALSGMETTSMDPNPDMETTFGETSTVPGAEYSMTAFGKASQEGKVAWQEETDDGDVDVPYFDPMGAKYDVIQEAMVFQFMSNEHDNPADRVMEREWQIARVKELMEDDGLFITEAKLHTPNSAANEAKKNKDHKALYFNKEDLDAKSAEVLEGMHKNMVKDVELEAILAGEFKHVRQFWDSGNFKGYVASDSLQTLDNFLGAMPSLDSDFSTTTTPRTVKEDQGTRQSKGAGEGRGFNSFDAKEVLQPLMDAFPLLDAKVVLDASELPADLQEALAKEEDGADSRGLYDTTTGELYILSANIHSVEELIEVFLHEGIGHKGLRLLLKEDFADTMDDIYANGDMTMIKSIARKYSLDLSSKEDRQVAVDEYIAFMAESDIESTVFQKVVAAVRQALRNAGLVKLWSTEDIKRLLRRSRAYAKGKPMSKAVIKTEYEVVETGEVVVISERGDVALRKADKRIAVVKKVRNCIS